MSFSLSHRLGLKDFSYPETNAAESSATPSRMIVRATRSASANGERAIAGKPGSDWFGVVILRGFEDLQHEWRFCLVRKLQKRGQDPLTFAAFAAARTMASASLTRLKLDGVRCPREGRHAKEVVGRP